MTAGGLTPREIECLRLVLERLTDQQIADRLGISKSRVSNSLGAAYRKLDIHDRMRAASKAGILYPGITMPGAAAVETRSPELAPTDGPHPPTDGETTSVPWLLAPYRRMRRTPPRLFGSLLPMILGWTLLGLVILAVFVGLLNVVVGSGDPYARRVDANYENGHLNGRPNQPAGPGSLP